MNKQTLNIYPNREKAFEMELKSLEQANISKDNRELITKFHNYLFSTGSGILRVTKISSQLRRICAKLDKPLSKLKKDDLVALIAIYNKDMRYSDATKADYRRTIKQFFRWFKEEDERLEAENAELKIETKRFYKFLEQEVSISYKTRQADAQTIINDDDCHSIIEQGCRTPRDKAFISLLHESGCRAGEFLNITLGDMTIRENHAELAVDGKTGRRTIFIVKSLPHLLRHIEGHPYKDNKQSYLWLSEAQHNNNMPLHHKGAQKIIDRCFQRAGVKKKHNLHWFRHSRATILAPKLTEAMLCKYMGWSLGSRQVKTYCHLSAKQLEDVILVMNGLKPKEEDEAKPIKCICGTLNNSSERYCFKCYKPLKVETVIQDQELVNTEINKTIQFMMEMTKNPELMKEFQEFKKNLEGKK